jgi:lipopolysaccharide export system protein LptA
MKANNPSSFYHHLLGANFAPHLRVVLGAVLLVALPLSTLALPGDNQQPINIQSDRATQKADDNGEKTEYFGNVIMTQGSLLINANHLVIHSINRKANKIIAIGQPAHFQQQSDPAKAPIQAKADHINYDLSSEKVILEGNANIEQNDANVSGNRIEYNVATEQVIAEERVNMVFTPVTKNSDDDTQTTPTAGAALVDPQQDKAIQSEADQKTPKPEAHKDTNGDTAS